MVWSLQNGCAVAGRDRARKGRCDQDCKSKRGRKPEPFVQVQHSRHSSVALLQKRATARPSHRYGEQKRFTRPHRRAGVRKFSPRENFVPEDVRPARLERATYGSGGRRSIQLSYGRGEV